MPLHDRLLAQLQSVAEVRLVSALRDPRLTFPNPNELHIFIPDLHLMTSERFTSGHFRFQTNFLPLLESVVLSLIGFKAGAFAGEKIVVYQIGDLFDLWRQTDSFDPREDVAATIADDHRELVDALQDDLLNTQFLLGNHDYDLFRFAGFAAWERYFFLSPSVMLLHGDIFDWVEKLPDAIQQFFVALFSPMVGPGRPDLERMRPINLAIRGQNQFKQFVQSAEPHVTARSAPIAEIPPFFNVQVAGVAPPFMLTFLDAAQANCARADAQFGTSLKVAIIGHTHHARIAIRETAGDLFTLIDCGAWIENCLVEDFPNPQPNAQIAVLGANEARIYQLFPLG